MKRIIFLLVVLYLVIGGLILIFVEDKSNEINYFTVDMDYSRLMSKDETLSFSLFIDNNQNFLIDKRNITSTSIKNEDIELSVDLIEFYEAESNIRYKDELYYQFVIEVGFNDLSLDGLDLNIETAVLTINYLNGESINISVGDLYLTFKEIEIDNYLDYISLSCLSEIVDNQEYIGAVVIKLNNLTNQDMEIIDIRSNNPKFNFSLTDNHYNEEKPSGFVSDIIDDYLNMSLIKDAFVLNDDGYYVIPVVYVDDYEKIFRFPIIIEYLYNNSLFELYIDDYLFLNEMVNFDEYMGNINTYIYQYQKSN